MATTIADIAAALEAWAPPGTAESWDVVGLHVGDPSRSVEKVLIALDATPQVLEEAVAIGATLVITHHPLLLKPVSRFTPASPTGYLAFQFAEAGIALYCIHTNIDRARDGVSFELARQLGIENPEFLGYIEERLVRLVTFVPVADADRVREAISDAGAGRIGRYEACSFSTEGTGRFRPLEGTNPAIGKAGGPMESVSEERIEVEVGRWQLPAVLTALQKSHPYEEVAYDIYPVEQSYRNAGYGAIGDLPDEEPLSAFLKRVSSALDNPALRYTGDLDAPVRKVAVCGGAGTPFIGTALGRKADAFVTADLSHHRYFEVLDLNGRPRMALIDAGHYETERVTEDFLRRFLEKTFSDVLWKVTDTRSGAASTFVAPR